MLLTVENIKDIARGCVRIEESNGTFSFMRFTEHQAQAYLDINKRDFYNKTYATAGVRLSFKTDSEHFEFDYELYGSSSRNFGYFDVYIDGRMKYHFGSEGADSMAGHADVILSKGIKNVEIYFPWTYCTKISNVTVSDGSFIEGVRRPKSILCFGDSITQGYDARYPSLSYTALLSSLLDADEINKGIGGDVFFPALLDEAECAAPDFITVAYGSNDWHKRTLEEFEVNYREFLGRLTRLYPTSKTFILSPIWHCVFDAVAKVGMTVPQQSALMQKICGEYPSLHYIDGSTLTPNRLEFYADKFSHPNDTGFAIYAAKLYAEIQKAIN